MNVFSKNHYFHISKNLQVLIKVQWVYVILRSVCVVSDFIGTCFSVETQNGYIFRQTLGTPAPGVCIFARFKVNCEDMPLRSFANYKVIMRRHRKEFRGSSKSRGARPWPIWPLCKFIYFVIFCLFVFLLYLANLVLL